MTTSRRRVGGSARRSPSRRAAMPASASASLRPISSVVSDFIFTTSSTPCARAISTTVAFASAASRAQCTRAPAASAALSNCNRYSSSRASTSALIARPASRSSCQSGSSATTRARFAWIVSVALRRFRRSCVFASSTRACSGNELISRRGSPRGAPSGSRSAHVRARRRSGADRTRRARCRPRLHSPGSLRTCRRASRSTCPRS